MFWLLSQTNVEKLTSVCLIITDEPLGQKPDDQSWKVKKGKLKQAGKSQFSVSHLVRNAWEKMHFLLSHVLDLPTQKLGATYWPIFYICCWNFSSQWHIFIYLFFDSEGRLVEQAGWVNWFKVKTEKIIDHFPEGNVAILCIIDYWESHFTVLKTGALVQQTSSGLKREKTEGRGVNAF